MGCRAVELLLIFTLPCVAACTVGPASRALAITTAPPPMVEGVTTSLRVPASCPVYAPGGGEVDTIEEPFPEMLNVGPGRAAAGAAARGRAGGRARGARAT